MNKTLVFDMDGTIADLYGVKNWLQMLENEEATPYLIAKPLYDMEKLNFLLNILKTKGWKIVVTTWLSKNSTDNYDKKVKKAKIQWLQENNFPYDDIFIVKYGYKKANCTKSYGGFQILIDDEERNRKEWNLGDTVDASQNILNFLVNLI